MLGTFARGLGRSGPEAITTRARSASTIASLQGGWRPWWAQGSSVTYIVAPADVLAAARRVGERRPLGVQTPELGVEALPDNLLAADDDRADQRIRADPTAAALGQRERLSQEFKVCWCR